MHTMYTRPLSLMSPFRQAIRYKIYRCYSAECQPHREPFHKSLDLIDFFAKSNEKSKPSYVFAHGAAGFAKKGRPVLEDRGDYRSVQVGEDAYFQRVDGLGVADGVGGWSGARAANVALCSRKLMHYCYLELERFDNIDDPCFYEYDKADPVKVLQESYNEALHEEEAEGIVGSTTACIALLRHDELRIANLGDCGISVIRNNSYLFRSEEQQHSFNFPYQLGTGSPDKPTDAQAFNVKIERGDIIILGSDGLYDNLFDRDILSLVRTHIAAYIMPGSIHRPPRLLNFNPQHLANALADRAKCVSEDRRNVDSPFQTRAIHEGFYYQGGKTDDITVLVAVVRDSEDSPDRRL
ncbi:phosphatase 2C-like domain-containing protein [Phycomyces nitens]|nr:phosphatase 2C-like domain-containing protein [Phycomyces nitens]